jgi:putative addiction module killer protein
MLRVRQTTHFQSWLRQLADRKAALRILQRLTRLELGLFGDVKYLDGIGELRIDEGPGYRVYFVRRGKLIVVVLCAGDKGSQRHDIARAKAMAEEIGDEG